MVDQLLVDQCLVDQSCPEFMLENLNKIELDNPVDLILSQIRELISTGAVMNFIQYKVCNFSNNKRAINEHQNILAMITTKMLIALCKLWNNTYLTLRNLVKTDDYSMEYSITFFTNEKTLNY